MKKNNPRKHEYSKRFISRKDTSESDFSDGEGSWSSHAYEPGAASATAAAVAAVTAPRPPPRGLGVPAPTSPVPHDCWIRQSARMQTRLVHPTAQQTFRADSVNVRGVGEGDIGHGRGVYPVGPCFEGQDCAAGGKGTRVCVEGVEAATASAAAAAVAASAVPRADILKLHYETEFVQLVRGQIERFDSSYKQWHTEMMEAQAAQRGSLQNVSAMTDRVLSEETVSTTTQTRSITLNSEPTRYQFPCQNDSRNQIWECNSEVQYYEEYSHSINNEIPHDLCSCYHTYKGTWGNYGKSWSGMEHISYPSSPQSDKESHTLQDSRFLSQPIEETNELDSSDWVYVNPYVCELPTPEQVSMLQKSQENASFSCYGSQPDKVNIPVEKALEDNQIKGDKWFQVSENESHENRTDNEIDKCSDDYDVQSQMDSYLEWRNQGSSKSNSATDITPRIKDYICTAIETKVRELKEESAKEKQHKVFPDGKISVCRTSILQDTSFHLQPVKDEPIQTKFQNLPAKVFEQHNTYQHEVEANEETKISNYFFQNIQNVDCKENMKDHTKAEEKRTTVNRDSNNSMQTSETPKNKITSPRKSINKRKEHQNIKFKSILPYDPQEKNRFTKHKDKSNIMKIERKEWHTPQVVKINEATKSDPNKNIKSHIKEKTRPITSVCNRKKKGEKFSPICRVKQETRNVPMNVPVPSRCHNKFNKSGRAEVRNMKTSDAAPLNTKLLNARINKDTPQTYIQTGMKCDRNTEISRKLSANVDNESLKLRDNSSLYKPLPLWEFRDSSGTRSNLEVGQKIATTQNLTLAMAGQENCILFKDPEKEHRIQHMEEKKRDSGILPSKRQKKEQLLYRYFDKYFSTDFDSSTTHRKTHIKKYFRKTLQENSRQKNKEIHNPKQKKILNVIWLRKKNSKSNESEDYPQSTDSETQENESLFTVDTNSSMDLSQKTKQTRLHITHDNGVGLSYPFEPIYETRESKKNCCQLTKTREKVDEPFHCIKLRNDHGEPRLMSVSTNDSDFISETENTLKENTVVYRGNISEKATVSTLPRRAIGILPELIMQGKEEKMLQDKTMPTDCTSSSCSSLDKKSSDIYDKYQCSVFPLENKKRTKQKDISQNSNNITAPTIVKQSPFSVGSVTVSEPVESFTENTMKCMTSARLTTAAINTPLTLSEINHEYQKQCEDNVSSQCKTHYSCAVMYFPDNVSERDILSEKQQLEAINILPTKSRTSVENETRGLETVPDSGKKGQVNNIYPIVNPNCQDDITTKKLEMMNDNSQRKYNNQINPSSHVDISIFDDDEHATILAQCEQTITKEFNDKAAYTVSGLLESTVSELMNQENIQARSDIHQTSQSDKSNENITFEITDKSTVCNDYLNKPILSPSTNEELTYTNETKLETLMVNTSQEETLRDRNLDINNTFETSESSINAVHKVLSQNISQCKEVEITNGKNRRLLQVNKSRQLLINNFYEHRNEHDEISSQTITFSEKKIPKNAIAVSTNSKKNSRRKILKTNKDENAPDKNIKEVKMQGVNQNQNIKSAIYLAPEREKKSSFYPRLCIKHNSKCKIKIVKEINKSKSTQTKKTISSKTGPKMTHSKLSDLKTQFENNISQHNLKNIFIINSDSKNNKENVTDRNDIILLKKVDYRKMSTALSKESLATPDNLYTLHTVRKCEDGSITTQDSNFPKEDNHVFQKEVLSCERFKMLGDATNSYQENPTIITQTETSNSSTQTDHYSTIDQNYSNRIRDTESSIFSQDQQKQISQPQNISSEDKNTYSAQNRNDTKIKSSLIQTAKEILRNDVFKLVFMQNYFTVEDIPLSKIHTLKEAAKELLTQKLRADTLTQYNIHSKTGKEEEKIKIKEKYVPQEKITDFKNMITSTKVPKREFPIWHISQPNKKVQTAEVDNTRPLLKTIKRNKFLPKSFLGDKSRTDKTRISQNLKPKTNLKTEMKTLTSVKRNTTKHKHRKKRNLQQILRTKLILQHMGLIVKDNIFETKAQMLPSDKFTIYFKLRNTDTHERAIVHPYLSVNEKGDAPNDNSLFKLSYPMIFTKTTGKGVQFSKKKNDNLPNLKRIPRFIYSFDGGDSNKKYPFHQNFAAFHLPVIQTKTFPTPTPVKTYMSQNFNSHDAIPTINQTKIKNMTKTTQLHPSTSQKIHNFTFNADSSDMKISSNSSSQNMKEIYQNQNDTTKLYFYKLNTNSVETTWDSVQHEKSKYTFTRQDENLWSNCIKGQEYEEVIHTTDLNKSPVSSIYSVKSFISEESHVSIIDEVVSSNSSTFQVGNLNCVSVMTTSQRPLQHEFCSQESHPNRKIGVCQISKYTQTSLHSDADYHISDISTQLCVSKEGCVNSIPFPNQPEITAPSNTSETQLPACSNSGYISFDQTPKNRTMNKFCDITMFSLIKAPENSIDPNINYAKDISIEVADGLKSTFYTKTLPPIEIKEPCLIHISNLEEKGPFETQYTPYFIPISSQMYEPHPKPLNQNKKELYKMNQNQSKIGLNKNNSMRKYKTGNKMKKSQKKMFKRVPHKLEYIISYCCLQTDLSFLQQFQGKETYVNKHDKYHDFENNKMTIIRDEIMTHTQMEQIHKANEKENNPKTKDNSHAPFHFKAPIPYYLKLITTYLKVPNLYGSHSSEERLFLTSNNFWRKIISLLTFLLLPFLMYTGSVLSLALCKSQTCSDYWPIFWPLNIWDQSQPHDTIINIVL